MNGPRICLRSPPPGNLLYQAELFMSALQGIRLVIFDLDGTLVDAYSAIIESFNYTMRRLGYSPQAPAVIRAAVGWGDENLLRPFVRTGDLQKALAVYRSRHGQALARRSRVFPGVRRMLAHLKRRGYLLAIASNRPTRFSRILVRHLRLEAYFDGMLCADKREMLKPRPRLIRDLMKRLGTRPSETVYVGDMHIDAQAGRRAGVRTFIVTGGSGGLKQCRGLRRSFCTLKTVADLDRLL